MKAVILAGGLGTRISEETHLKPKPMIEIGQKPILWHICQSALKSFHLSASKSFHFALDIYTVFNPDFRCLNR